MSDNKSRFPYIIVFVPIILVLLLGFVIVYNNRPPSVKVPNPKMPNPNAYDDFVMAVNILGKKKHFGPLSDPNRKPEQWTMAEYESFIADNMPVVQKLREGLRKDYRVPPYTPHGNPFKSLSGFRELARTLAGEALYYERRKDYNSAMNCRLDSMEMGCMIPKGGNLIYGLTGAAVEAIGTNEIDTDILHLNSKELRDAARRLEIINAKRVTFSEMMEEDGNCTAINLSEAFAESDRLKNAWDIPSVFSTRSSINDVALSLRSVIGNKKYWIQDIQAYYKNVAREQRGYYKGPSRVRKPSNPLAVFIVDHDKCHIVLLKPEAILALIQTEIAIRRYKADNGSYPNSLSQLIPKYLKKSPVDPYGKGKILKYKPIKSNRSFILYSLGPDMDDDGGKHVKPGELKKDGDLFIDKQW